jgi:flagellar FliL protein
VCETFESFASWANEGLDFNHGKVSKMADEDVTQELEKAVAQPASNSKNPLLTILLLLNTVIMGAVAYFQYESFQKISKQESIRDVIEASTKDPAQYSEDFEGTGEARQDDGILFALDPFTANLAQGDGPRRFLRLNAVLKFSRDSNEAEFNTRKPQIRDTIISTLNSKRPQDLLEVEGKEFLKEELKSAINSFLVDGHVVDIYYVGFQIN